MATPQLLDWPVDQPLAISGPPGSMRFPVSMAKVSDKNLTQPAVALINVRATSGATLEPRSLTLGLGVSGGETAKGTAHLRLDPGTPPGSYSGKIEIAGVTRSIEINVLEQVKLSIRPLPLVFDRAHGLSQTLPVTFENKGNVALRIDVSGVYPLGLELPIMSCHQGEGEASSIEQLTELFTGLLGTRGRPALREVGMIDLAMPDGALMLAPGSSQTGLISMTVPDGLSPAARFRAYVPVYIADLEIVVITATKQTPATKPNLRTKGAAS
jgi:hypothetical protein